MLFCFGGASHCVFPAESKRSPKCVCMCVCIFSFPLCLGFFSVLCSSVVYKVDGLCELRGGLTVQRTLIDGLLCNWTRLDQTGQVLTLFWPRALAVSFFFFFLALFLVFLCLSTLVTLLPHKKYIHTYLFVLLLDFFLSSSLLIHGCCHYSLSSVSFLPSLAHFVCQCTFRTHFIP